MINGEEGKDRERQRARQVEPAGVLEDAASRITLCISTGGI